ncbi:hypothetical protein ACSBR1_031719 [Camellia fascicularis]
MEDGVRSSGGLVKKKSSSGCLIIKKKVDGTSGVGVSGSRKDFQSNKEIKRSRFDFSDAESIDELLEPVRRKVVYGTDRFRNGSAVNSENLVEDSKFGQNGEIGSERKRRLDAVEFYDYDGIDGKRTRKDYLQSRFTIAGRSGSEREFETGSIRHVMMDKRSEREFETGSSKHVMIDKRKHSYFDSASNSSAGRKDVPDYTVKSRFGIEDGEAHLPVSSLRREFHVSSDETIRLQGKNGVLKVMVNKKKKMEELPHKFYDRQLEVESRKGYISENAIKKNTFVGPSLYSCSKRHEKETSVGPSFYLGSKCHEKNSSVGPSFSLDSKHPEKNTSAKPSFYSDSKCPEKAISFVKTEKSELKLQKPLSVISKAGNSETEDSDTLLRLGPSVQARSLSKGVKSEGKAPSAEKITPDRGEEGKVKRGYGKEKKLLRDTSLSLGPSVQGCGSLKRVKKSEGKAPSAEKIMPDTGKEGKAKRGYGTEKQLLREKIRAMLVSAGWTIDYRPRRNRDYLDAVYINPTGTAYWSIIKAYEALQKQLEEEDAEIKHTGHSLQFTALPEEVVSKLTRQTRKKVEKEMKRKRKDHGRSKTVKGVSMEEFADGTVGDKDDKKLNFIMKQNGKSPKGRSHETTCVSGDNSSGALYKGSSKQERAEKPSTATNSHMIQARKSRKIGRCTLLVRSSDKKLNSESDSYVPYTGKRTLLSWLIDSGMVHLSEKVQYMNRRRTRVKLKGWISRDGIHCGCCSKILTVLKFEIHAGSKLRQPFQNIYVESGVSLLQRQIDAWNKQEESERCGFHPVDVDGDPNDDTCGLCGDGGDLICCDGCPSTFHQSCLDIQMLPAGDWHCPNCTCKFCGIAGLINAHRNGTNVGVLLTCGLCEKKYHESCSKEKDALPDDSNCLSTSFCGQKCRELFDHLEKLLGARHELEAGFSWSIVHRTDLDTDASDHGFPQRVECNSKLAVALSVMDECFLPIVDRRSGINLIHNVLYNCGSNFSRLNYSGFYTAILERGDEIISAASIRIHGTQLAEMPFIGTRHIYRRQGMCRRLFSAIEMVLCSLKVEKLIIPATAEHMHTWTGVFGFNPLEESQKQEMRSMNMLVFPGTDMLQKLLVEQKTTDGNIIANSGVKSVMIKVKHHLMPDLAKKSDADSLAGCDLNIRDDASLQNADEINDKAAAVDSSLQVPAIPSNDKACLDSSFDVPSEPEVPVLSEEKTNQSVENLTESSVNHALLEMENPALDPSVKGKSSMEKVINDVHEANIEAAVMEPVHDLLGESSTMNIAEEIKGDQNFLSGSTLNGTDDTTKKLNSDLNPSAVGMECKLHVASEVSSEAKVELVEDNIQSSTASDSDGARETNFEVACVKPVLGSFGDISGQNTTEEINDNLNPVSLSTPCDTDESNMRCSSDLNHQSTFEVESEFLVPHEFNDKVACVKPDHDCFGEISAQNKDVNEDQNPVSALVFDGSTIRFNTDMKKMESNLHAASEEVAKVRSNIPSNADDDAGEDAHEVNVIDASVEPIVNSSDGTSVGIATEVVKENVAVSTFHGSHHSGGSTVQFESDWIHHRATEMETVIDVSVEPIVNSSDGTSAENATKVVKENVAVSTFHGSDDSAGSTVQFESDWIHHSATEVETEIHVDSEIPADAMFCESNI